MYFPIQRFLKTLVNSMQLHYHDITWCKVEISWNTQWGFLSYLS